MKAAGGTAAKSTLSVPAPGTCRRRGATRPVSLAAKREAISMSSATGEAGASGRSTSSVPGGIRRTIRSFCATTMSQSAIRMILPDCNRADRRFLDKTRRPRDERGEFRLVGGGEVDERRPDAAGIMPGQAKAGFDQRDGIAPAPDANERKIELSKQALDSRAVAILQGLKVARRQLGQEGKDGGRVAANADRKTLSADDLRRRHAVDDRKPVAGGELQADQRLEIADAVLDGNKVRARFGEAEDGVGRQDTVVAAVNDD